MEFFNGPVERWVKSEKTPVFEGFAVKIPKVSDPLIFGSSKLDPNTTTVTRNHLLGELQSNWVQPHLRTTSAGHWPNNLPS